MHTRLAYPALLALFGLFVWLGAGAGAIGFTLAATSISIVLFVVELVWPLVAEERVIGDPEVASDIGHTALANGVAQLTDAAMLAVGAIVAGRLGATWGVHLWPVGWPFVGQVIVLVVVADGLVYWLHRLEHRVPWLWRIHALHHDVERLHVIKSGRNTFVDMALRSLAVYGPLAALGAPADVIVWHPLALLVLGPIGHANVALPVPDVVHRLIVTPQNHRVHHAKDRRLADGNFAVVTPLWDLLFGTFIDPTGMPPPAVGVDEPLAGGFVRQALSPLVWGRSPVDVAAIGVRQSA
jgi:sterol desaturase/sphingolipid hydroxylase (fatty acid hydroxylase superfamily)